MGVYINMEMPDGCVVCPFFIENHHDRGDDSLCRASGKDAKCGCPLVPVPPHGRLIDADAMLMRINHEGMEAYMDGVCYGVHPSQEYLYLLGEIIDDAPTIIPAEEGE